MCVRFSPSLTKKKKLTYILNVHPKLSPCHSCPNKASRKKNANKISPPLILLHPNQDLINYGNWPITTPSPSRCISQKLSARGFFLFERSELEMFRSSYILCYIAKDSPYIVLCMILMLQTKVMELADSQQRYPFSGFAPIVTEAEPIELHRKHSPLPSHLHSHDKRSGSRNASRYSHVVPALERSRKPRPRQLQPVLLYIP